MIGREIRKKRIERGWQQTELAQQAGVSQQAVSKIERGLSREPKTLPRICKALGLSVDEMLTSSGDDLAPRRTFRENSGARARNPDRSTRARWPFLLPYSRFDQLTPPQKLKIEGILITEIAKIEAKAASARLKRER